MVGPKLEKNLLFTFEDAVVDVLANVDHKFLEKFGLEPNGQKLANGNCEQLFAELEKLNPKLCPGGAGFTVVKVVQWLTNFPKLTTFVSCVGRDQPGETYKKSGEDFEVDAYFCELGDKPTGKVAVLVNGANRAMVAKNVFDQRFKEFVEGPQVWKLVEKAQFFYLSAYVLNISAETMLKVAKHAADAGKHVTLNLSAVYLAMKHKDILPGFFKMVDLLFGDEDETKAFAKVLGFNGNEIKDVATELCDFPKLNTKRTRVVVITRSIDTIVATSEGVFTFPASHFDTEELVDTCGAGHAFTGGYLSQLLQGKSVPDCVRAGHYAASAMNKHLGSTLPQVSTFV